LKLIDIVGRDGNPKAWAEGEKIPWDEPEFSRRMLREHLSQAHDAASRRSEIIDRQVGWIHDEVLKGTPTRILDLGCGPGLYTSRLARLGHGCVGIDFSPASIEYARGEAEAADLDCQYVLQDLRRADFGEGYGLAMSIYGEFNVFRRGEARDILARVCQALNPEGRLLLEAHTFEKVVELGRQAPMWYSAESGLFSDEPYLCLRENFWDADERVAIQRYYMVDAATGEVRRHSSSMQAYSEEEYRELLAECGFEGALREAVFFPSLGGEVQEGLVVIVARKIGGILRTGGVSL
jgi:SAM-dependent methyltransferase